MIVWRNIVFGCLSSSCWFVCWLWCMIWLCCVFWCMIIVIVHFTMSIVWVSPLQLQYQIKNYGLSRISLKNIYFLKLERINNPSTYFCLKCMVFLWKIFFSEMILVPSFVTPFINLVLWYVYILKIMIWCISTWFGTRNWYLWKGYCQTENKCQAEKAELKKKNILFLFTDIVKFNIRAKWNFSLGTQKSKFIWYLQFLIPWWYLLLSQQTDGVSN